MLLSYLGTGGGGSNGVRTKEDSQLYNGAPAVCSIMLLQARAIYRFIKSAHNLLFDQQPTLR